MQQELQQPFITLPLRLELRHQLPDYWRFSRPLPCQLGLEEHSTKRRRFELLNQKLINRLAIYLDKPDSDTPSYIIILFHHFSASHKI